MKEPTPKHEKIRFRRRDVSGLHTYPSAGTQALAAKPQLLPAWLLSLTKWFGLTLVALALLVAAALSILPTTGLESAWLRDQAVRAIDQIADDLADTQIGRATLALDRQHFLAIGIDQLEITELDGGVTFATADRLGLGIRFWPLLSGKLEIGSATLTDARITVPSGAFARQGEGASQLFDDDGLINPDKLVEAVFSGLESALGGTGASGFETIRLDNVELILTGSSPVRSAKIVSAMLRRTVAGSADITAEILALDHSIHIEGSANAQLSGSAPAKFRISAKTVENGKTYEIGSDVPEGHGSVRLGAITVNVQGEASSASGTSNISILADVANSEVVAGTSPRFNARADVRATLAQGSGALWLDRIHITAARSSASFNGKIAPQPASEGDENGATYRFQMVGSEASVAPQDSPEPALALLARLSGWIAPDGRRIVANEISVATGRGQVIGSGALEIVPGKSPGLSLAIAVAQMPVSHAKNLWPFFSARGARSWALANVFGGTVENSRLLLRVPPGRIGDGIPLNSDEVSGHFEVAGARFDVTGTIPPMRDAIGSIDFAGTNVNIALSSGTVFMESGRTLKARNGTLVIKDAHLKPLIGEVDIEIDGSAAAVTEVAGYEPINLSKYLPISPDGISGTAKGRVLASVPLEDNISRDDLDWHLELAYENLSLAEPYEGQRIEDAKGTLVADPDSADFVAEAKLNGIRGELSLSEPLGLNKSERKRRARLFLEDGDSDKLFDGLSTLVSGPLIIDVEQLGPGKEKVSVDLKNAQLDLPWIGWSKNKGVMAHADFVMSRDAGKTALNDFSLSGGKFSGAGSLIADEKGLASARFTKLALSPSDNISMGIDRNGNDYTINVAGQDLDGRFLIKRFANMSQLAASGAGESSNVSVKVNAEVARVAGFNGQTLVGAKLAYSDASSKLPGFRVSASTENGARTTIVDATAGGMRKVEIKADDAGTVLRFLDVYDKLGGGRAAMSLSGKSGGTLNGQLEVREFSIIDEARLDSIVNRAPAGSDRSLSEAVKRDVDVSRASFDRGFANVEMGADYIRVASGVVRGPLVGSTFEGYVFDGQGNMEINGTFLPAYGINRIFGEIPLLGQILGNGRGGGLIGITYRLAGPTSEPKLQINPLSAVAPGIFRSIFEFRSRE